MKMWDNFLKWYHFKYDKEKWVLVKTIHEDFIFSEDRQKKMVSRFYYRLYESSRGNRQVRFACDKAGLLSLEYIANQRQLYHEKILRWRDGRYDPDIPRYTEIDQEDTVNALKGSI